MKRGPAILLGGLLSLSAVSWWAGAVGAFAPTPQAAPPSIREGSATAPLATGRSRTRYFVGGGIHRGK